MNTATTTLLSAGSTGEPYISGNFAPLMNEVTAFDLEVIGRIPEALNGRFLQRIGREPGNYGLFFGQRQHLPQ